MPILKINISIKSMALKLWLTNLLFSTLCLISYSQINEEPNYWGVFEIKKGSDLFDIGLLNKSRNTLLDALQRFPETSLEDKSSLLLADIDIRKGNYSTAHTEINKFIRNRKNSPLIPHAHLLKSVLALEQKKYADAVIYLSDTRTAAEAELGARHDTLYKYIIEEAIYWKAISLAQQGNYQDANPLFTECYEKYPEGEYADDCLYALGRSSEINGNYDEASEYFGKVGKNYSYRNTFISSQIREANNKLILREPSYSIVILDKSETALNHIQSNDSIGNLYEEQSYLKNAREHIQYLRAESYNSLGNYSQALLNFKAFLETFTESPLTNQVKLSTAWAFLNLGSNDSAISYYNDIIFNSSDTTSNDIQIRARALFYKAIAIKQTGNIEEAKNEFSALSMQPDYQLLGLVLLELGQIYYEQGDWEQARKTLERADRETLDGNISVRIQLLLGAVNVELKRWEKAVSYYSMAEQLALKSTVIYMPKKDWYLNEARLKKGITLVKAMRSTEAIQPLVNFIAVNKKDSRMEEALFWLAESYYRSDMLNNAIDTYNSLLNLFPDTKRKEEILYSMGWAYFRLRDFVNSSATFDRLIADFPETKFSAEVLTRQGDGYYLIKNYNAAAKFYTRAKQIAPNTDEGQYSAYQLCHALYRMGALEESITQLMDFVRRYPSSPFAPNSVYLMGWIRFQQKRFTEAIGNFNYLINSYPQSELVPRAHYAIGDAYYNLERYDEAIAEYKSVIESYPSNPLAPEAMKSVQYCLIALGREDEAIADIDNYINTNPNSPFTTDFKYKKGELFYTGRKYRDAITEYEGILKVNPDNERNAEALYWIEKSYINLNEAEKAKETLERMIKKYKKSEYVPLGILELGLMYKRNSDISTADSIFLNLQTLYPQHQSSAQAGFERANMRYNTGDTLEAIKIFRDIAESFRGTEFGEQSRWKIAMHLRQLGLNDSSRAEFEKLTTDAVDPSIAAEAHYRIGELWIRDKNFEKAVPPLIHVKEKFAGYEDWYSLAILNLGECYEQLNNFEAAKEEYQSLKALRPNDDFGKIAVRRLKRIQKN